MYNLESDLDRKKRIVKEAFNPYAQALDNAYLIPKDKEQQIVVFALNYFSKHQDMKPPRFAKKVAEYFKLKKKPAIASH